MKVSIVVPLYNESQSLEALMQSINAVFEKINVSYTVLFIDDGSTDNSFEICKQLYDQYPGRVQVYRFSRNFGKSAALRAGIAKAEGDVIVTMDADLQDDPEAIPAMLEKLEQGWDVVSGWKKKRHDPLSKTFPSKVWNFLTSTISGLHLHDFNCGFKAYRIAAAKSLDIYGERHRYLPALAHWEGFKVTEIPVPHHPRQFGKSKYGIGRIFNGIFDLITILFLKKYLTNPLHFFGLLGMFFCLAGSTVLAYFGVQWLITGQMRVRPLVFLSMGAIIVGIQFFSIGLIGEMITHAQHKDSYLIKDSFTTKGSTQKV